MSRTSPDRQTPKAVPHLTRRSFLASLAALATFGGAALGPSATPAVAVAPLLTAVAVANLALGLISLFRSGGPGVGDLLRLQTELLVRISEQLAVIQEGINLILRRLDEIEELIGTIPQAVVNELSRAQITALLGRYEEILSTYQADVQAKGIEYAQKSNLDEIEKELLVPLRASRAILMTHNNRVNLPLLAAALYTETHTMILANYRPTRIVQAIARYRTWIEELLRGQAPTALEKAISETKMAREKLLAETRAASKDFGCFVQTGGSIDDICGIGGTPNVRLTGVVRRGRRSFPIHSIDDPTLVSAVQTLLSKQVIAADEAPLSLAATSYETSDDQYNFCAKQRGDSRIGLTEDFWTQHTSCDTAQAAVEAEHKRLKDGLEGNSMQLIVLRSLEKTAIEALNFADGMTADLLASGQGR